MRAQKDTQDAFMRYTSCLDIERQARQAVASAEKRRDDISTPFIPKAHLATILTALITSQWLSYSPRTRFLWVRQLPLLTMAPRLHSFQIRNQESHQYLVIIAAVPQDIRWR
jgi:hypothetical protein